MGILGYSAPPAKQDTSGAASAASLAANSNPQGIFQVVDSFVSDPGYRKNFLSDPNAALQSAGVNVGGAKISATYNEVNAGANQNTGSGSLLIHVENGGANWTGAATLVITK